MESCDRPPYGLGVGRGDRRPAPDSPVTRVDSHVNHVDVFGVGSRGHSQLLSVVVQTLRPFAGRSEEV
mgnify:CR=1 FL=1|jgi:hypothetical protein